jgi:hypothetical protein
MTRHDLLPALAVIAVIAVIGGPPLIAAHPAAAAAGTGSIEGTVLDASSGAIVSGGKIGVAAACGAVRKTGAVDAVGHFSIADLPEGACTLSARGSAYVTASLSVTVIAGSIATVLVSVVSQESAQLQARGEVITVTGSLIGRKEVDSPSPVSIVDREQLVVDQTAPAKPVRAAPARVVRAPALAVNQDLRAARPMIPAKPVRLEAAKRRGPVAERNLRGAFEAGVLGDGVVPEADGWAVVRVFPVPQYTRAYDGPRTDFRETIYWNPSVETNASGDADVAFVMSDAVTAFRATAEGFASSGAPGAGQVTLASRLPLTLDAHLPVEVTSGDAIGLPITLANETDEPIDALLSARFGAAFKLVSDPGTGPIHLAARQKSSLLFPLVVAPGVGTDSDTGVAIKLTARGLTDEINKTIRVVARGFPAEVSASGTARRGDPARQVLDLAGALPGSIRARVTMYPSPVAAMATGMRACSASPAAASSRLRRPTTPTS